MKGGVTTPVAPKRRRAATAAKKSTLRRSLAALEKHPDNCPAYPSEAPGIMELQFLWNPFSPSPVMMAAAPHKMRTIRTIMI